MTIFVASDHAVLELKKSVLKILDRLNVGYEDLGPERYDKGDDYTDYAFKLGERVGSGKNLGILICDTGTGMAIAANKVKGVRAGLVFNDFQAMRAKKHDNVNVLVLSTEDADERDFELIIKTWHETEFSGERRYKRRINKIKQYENNTYRPD